MSSRNQAKCICIALIAQRSFVENHNVNDCNILTSSFFYSHSLADWSWAIISILFPTLALISQWSDEDRKSSSKTREF